MKNTTLSPETRNKLNQDLAKSIKLAKERLALAWELIREEKQFFTKKNKIKK